MHHEDIAWEWVMGYLAFQSYKIYSLHSQGL